MSSFRNTLLLALFHGSWCILLYHNGLSWGVALKKFLLFPNAQKMIATAYQCIQRSNNQTLKYTRWLNKLVVHGCSSIIGQWPFQLSTLVPYTVHGFTLGGFDWVFYRVKHMHWAVVHGLSLVQINYGLLDCLRNSSMLLHNSHIADESDPLKGFTWPGPSVSTLQSKGPKLNSTL